MSDETKAAPETTTETETVETAPAAPENSGVVDSDRDPTPEELKQMYTTQIESDKKEEEKPAVETANEDAQAAEAKAGEPEEKKQESDDEIMPELLARASELGWSEEDVKSLGAQKLGRLLSTLEVQREATRETKETPAKPEPEKVAAKAPAIDWKKYGELDPNILSALKDLQANYETALAERDAKLGKMEQHFNQQAYDEFGHWFEGKVKGLGKEYAEVIKGGGERKILDAMEVIHKGLVASKAKIPARDELFETAKLLAFGAKTQEIARKEITNKVEKRKALITARPTQRDTSKRETGADRATKFAAEFLKSRKDSDE